MPFFVLPGELFCLDDHRKDHVEDGLVLDGNTGKGGKGNTVIHAILHHILSIGNVPCCFHIILILEFKKKNHTVDDAKSTISVAIDLTHSHCSSDDLRSPRKAYQKAREKEREIS